MSNEWIQTYTGKGHILSEPQYQELDIEDISHALSNICRFGGHTKEFYSVAQHSVLVSMHVPKNALWGLLHDAAEAYVGDVLSPIKWMMRSRNQYTHFQLESDTLCSILGDHKLAMPIPDDVKEADMRILMTECRDLMGGERGGKWSIQAEPYVDKIIPWDPKDARWEFLERYKELTG